MPVLLTIDEVAPVLKIRPVTVRRLIASGKLPYIKIGKRYMFSDKNIESFIARNTHNETGGDHEAT